MTSEKTDQIAAALAAVQAELKPVPRTSENPFFHSRYAELSTCVKHAAPLLTANGLSVVQVGQATENGSVALVTTLLHKSGQWISGTMSVKPSKEDPQGYGSAITYLRRYGFCAIIGLTQEGEDDDANAASSATPEKHTRTTPYEQKKPSPASKADLKTLREWLESAGIPEDFVMGELRDKGLAELGDESLDDLKPGVITRTLKSKNRLATSWLESQGGKEKAAKAKDEPVRTREGDQSRNGVRQPIQSDITPQELLEQEGVDDWRAVKVHFGKQKGELLSDIGDKSLSWWINNWVPKQYKGKWSDDDLMLDAALCVASAELTKE